MAIEELLVITVLKVCKITDMTINKLQLQRFSFQLLFQLLITSLDFTRDWDVFFLSFITTTHKLALFSQEKEMRKCTLFMIKLEQTWGSVKTVTSDKYEPFIKLQKEVMKQYSRYRNIGIKI